VVKVCLPSTQTQADYDIRFINFLKGKFLNYLK
jgi:DNA-dependent RNA polymerase auxiliary subunit epsilon